MNVKKMRKKWFKNKEVIHEMSKVVHHDFFIKEHKETFNKMIEEDFEKISNKIFSYTNFFNKNFVLENKKLFIILNMIKNEIDHILKKVKKE